MRIQKNTGLLSPLLLLLALCGLVGTFQSACGPANNSTSPTDECVVGEPGCACYPNDTCNADVMCVNQVCEAMTQDQLDMPPSPDLSMDMEMQDMEVITHEMTQSIGPEGGTIVLGDMEGAGRMEIPAGALSEMVEISVREVSGAQVPGYDLFGSRFDFGPEGTTFATPITVRLPASQAPVGASMYWSRQDEPGFERLPTVLEQGFAVAEVSHFSQGFVGQPADVPLQELPITCLDVGVEQIDTYAPSAVRTRFLLTHCDGWPVVRDLEPGDVKIINDVSGEEFNVSLEGGGASAPERVELGQITTSLSAVLSIDMSNSIVNSGAADDILDAAQGFVDTLVKDAPAEYRYAIAIQAFGSSGGTMVVQDFSSDPEALTAALDALRTSPGLGSTNLYGAYDQALSLLEGRTTQADVADRTMVLLTDGKHEAGDFDNQRIQALARRDAARAQDIKIYSIAINAPPEDRPFLEELATDPALFDAAATSEEAKKSFERTSEYLRRIPEATYVVGVCTPVELGDASLTIEVTLDGVTGRVSVPYSTAQLNGNTSMCVPEDIAVPCRGRSCGPGAIPGVTCGDCIGGSCEASMCMCPENQSLCGNACVALDTPENCGMCGVSCGVSCNTTQRVCEEASGMYVMRSSSCALMTSGVVKCWGGSYSGQLGDGTTTDQSVSVEVQGLTNVASLSSGYGYYMCALLQSGQVKCWGDNTYGQLGDGTTSYRSVPVEVQGLTNVASLSSGYAHSCALLQNGQVKCWGLNSVGQLGDGTTTDQSVPVEVQGLTSVTSLSSENEHMCALLQNGQVKCWGRNNFGQLGDGTVTADRSVPVEVQGLTNVASLSLGAGHSCALLQSGQVKCWGRNYSGQLGDGTTTPQSVPVEVQGLTNVASLSLGDLHSCALLQNGQVKCWGQNRYGQLGDGTTTPQSVPVEVQGLTNVASLSLGTEHSCALLQSGQVKCWGYNNYGQLGDGTTTNQKVPVEVQGLTSVASLSSGFRGIQHRCALLQSGQVKCWGYNEFGQLGDGTTTDQSVPVEVQW